MVKTIIDEDGTESYLGDDRLNSILISLKKRVQRFYSLKGILNALI